MMGVPAKLAAVMVLVIVKISFTDCGKPSACTRTDVPAGPVEGVRVTVGAVIVKVTACTTVCASVICTL